MLSGLSVKEVEPCCATLCVLWFFGFLKKIFSELFKNIYSFDFFLLRKGKYIKNFLLEERGDHLGLFGF